MPKYWANLKSGVSIRKRKKRRLNLFFGIFPPPSESQQVNQQPVPPKNINGEPEILFSSRVGSNSVASWLGDITIPLPFLSLSIPCAQFFLECLCQKRKMIFWRHCTFHSPDPFRPGWLNKKGENTCVSRKFHFLKILQLMSVQHSPTPIFYRSVSNLWAAQIEKKRKKGECRFVLRCPKCGPNVLLINCNKNGFSNGI